MLSLGRIWQALKGQAEEMLFGETTMTVQALDLRLAIPIGRRFFPARRFDC